MKRIGKPTLMVINENKLVLLSILLALKKYYQVTVFSSGVMALKFLSCNLTDLILIGDKTSDLSGYEVLDKLKSDDNMRVAPVIFLSNPSDKNGGLQALTKGATDYISGPVQSHVLLKRIYIHLKLQALRGQLDALAEEKTISPDSNPARLKDSILDLLRQITNLLDNETGEHIERVSGYARIMVKSLLEQPHPSYTLTELEADDIVNAAIFHDLGKIFIPEQLLYKPGKLTDEEFEIIKCHSTKGANLLNAILTQVASDSFLKKAYEITLYHHEKWNGQGYPQKLKGNYIPISARIIAIVDVYDALTHTRSYRTAFSHSQAAEIIEQEAGTHFDPYLVEVFLKHQQEFKNFVYAA